MDSLYLEFIFLLFLTVDRERLSAFEFRMKKTLILSIFFFFVLSSFFSLILSSKLFSRCINVTGL